MPRLSEFLAMDNLERNGMVDLGGWTRRRMDRILGITEEYDLELYMHER